MTSDTLHCRCGGEVRIVRLNARTLALGHVRNPGPKSHAVRLSPAARNAFPEATEQPEAPDASRREESLAPHLTTNSTRAASKGAPRTAITSGANTSSPQSRRGAWAPSPVGADPASVAASPALAAGRPRTAGVHNKGRVAT